MQIQNRALVQDPFPGKCSVCKENTDNPCSKVMFTAKYHSTEQNYGSQNTVFSSYTEILEHPLRVCDSCAALKGNFGKIIKITLFPAILFAIFIGSIDDFLLPPICAGTLGGLILIGGILLFTYHSPESIRIGRQKENLLRYREKSSGSYETSYKVLSEDEFLELAKKNGINVQS